MRAVQKSSWVALVAFAGAGCTVDEHHQTTPIPHVTYEKTSSYAAEYEVGEAYVLSPADGTTVGQVMAEFCTRIAAQGGPSVSFAPLPAVTYDLRREAPWVSELGLRLANDLAQRMDDAGYRGPVLTTRELDVRMQQRGVDKSNLSTLPAVAQQGAAIGVDVVAFATMKRENGIGAPGRDVITLSFTALEVGTGTELAHSSFEVASDIETNRTFFDLAQRESLWLPGAR